MGKNIRSEIVFIDEIVSEQVDDFKYLHCVISIGKETELDVAKKLAKFQMTCDVLKNKTWIIFLHTMTTSSPLYGRETWLPSRKTLNKIQSSEMKNKELHQDEYVYAMTKQEISFGCFSYKVQFRNIG